MQTESGCVAVMVQHDGHPGHRCMNRGMRNPLVVGLRELVAEGCSCHAALIRCRDGRYQWLGALPAD
jgi:hypothetical protein